MPRALPALLLLCALTALCACGRQSAREGEDAASLRERIERLERQAEEDRARESEDIRAMREDLDVLRTNLEAMGAAPRSDNATAAGPRKSPRAALRQSFHEAVEASKNALERLNKGLEKSLSRPKKQQETEPAQER